jgi:hypothetical protein
LSVGFFQVEWEFAGAGVQRGEKIRVTDRNRYRGGIVFGIPVNARGAFIQID